MVGDKRESPSGWQSRAVKLRRIPYPYSAVLAICSDLDETPDERTYFEIIRYLNTTEQTRIGRGVGLEVGNTIYFDMPPGQFSYWNTDDAGRKMIRALIRSGHIDCLHSYGDLASTRAHAAKALDELSKHDCRMEVWVDHGTAPSNFGPDIMKGLGDLRGSEVYHADLTCAYGIQFVWLGRVTSVLGQNAKRSLEGIFNASHSVPSVKTVWKEFGKGFAASFGNSKYAMHRANHVLRKIWLRDGRAAHEFIRSNPHWGGVSCGETADGLAEVLTARVLDRLVERGGFTILYTHLGKMKDKRNIFSPGTRQALERLCQYCRGGNILVTTTRRVLGLCRAIRDLAWSTSQEGECVRIDVRFDGLEEDLGGITFYTPDNAKSELFLNGSRIAELQRNPKDHTGRQSVSLPWKVLEFPAL